MTTFAKIHDDTAEYREHFSKIVRLLDEVTWDKVDHTQIMTWFRRRRFYVRNEIDPILALMETRMSAIVRKLEPEAPTKSDKAALYEQYLVQQKQVTAYRQTQLQVIEDRYNDSLKELGNALRVNSEWYRDAGMLIKKFDSPFDPDNPDDFDSEWRQYAESHMEFEGVSQPSTGYRTQQTLNQLLADQQSARSKSEEARTSTAQLKQDKKRDLEHLEALVAERRETNKKQYQTDKLKLKEQQNDEADETAKTEDLRQEQTHLSRVISAAEGTAALINSIGTSNELKDRTDEINEAFTQLERLLATVGEQRNFTRVPKEADVGELSKRYDAITDEIDQARMLYPQKKMKPALGVLVTIKHDIANDRGAAAFTSRSEELKSSANVALEWFNTHMWQITGRRWQRTGTNTWGYVSVTPEMDAIPLI